MRTKMIVCGLYGENAYLISRDAADQAVLIDPGDDLPALQEAIGESRKRLGAILLTHGHFDHMLCAAWLKEKFACPVYIHRLDAAYLKDARLNCYDPPASRQPFTPMEPDHLLDAAAGGTPLQVCGYDFLVYHTPGHTPGSVCYQLEGGGVLFTGDTLFARGYGRMDLPGGSEAQMSASLGRLLALPRELTICPGHGETSSLGQAGDMLW